MVSTEDRVHALVAQLREMTGAPEPDDATSVQPAWESAGVYFSFRCYEEGHVWWFYFDPPTESIGEYIEVESPNPPPRFVELLREAYEA